ncbi:MAG TPA: hypothetical protein VJT31_38360 [Rugosimonospora sp.]|nr:hypothetical protein [Rugosimonospora sp.]
MSVLHWGDDDMHYSDNSHRWIAPENMEQTTWEAGVRAHLAQHLATMGGPVRHDEQRAMWTRRKIEARGAARATRTARVSRRVLRVATGQPEAGEPSAA